MGEKCVHTMGNCSRRDDAVTNRAVMDLVGNSDVLRWQLLRVVQGVLLRLVVTLEVVFALTRHAHRK